MLPMPRLVVFYNGTKETEEEQILQLSDSFPEDAQADIEVQVRMININYGQSQKLLEACTPLKDYSWMIKTIRDHVSEGQDIETAVDRTINEMPPSFQIKAFLQAHRAEVRGMLLTEYNEAETMERFREDGIAEGLQQGRAEGRAEERKNTDKERARADAAEKELKKYRELYGMLSTN